MLATAASGQAKHHPVYPGTRTVRGAIWDRLGGAWRLTEDALLKSERLRFIYSRNEPPSIGIWTYRRCDGKWRDCLQEIGRPGRHVGRTWEVWR